MLRRCVEPIPLHAAPQLVAEALRGVARLQQGIEVRRGLGEIVRATGNRVTQDVDDPHIGAALFAGSREALSALARRLTRREGPIVPMHLAPYRHEALLDEVSLSVNTAAAGGNASLMTIG